MCDTEEVAIIIPQALKTHLEDDCVQIVKRGKLLKLPRKPNVEALLKNYFAYCVSNSTEDTNLTLTAEVLDGIKIYFDIVLPDHLLYVQERQQYALYFPQREQKASPQQDFADCTNHILADADVSSVSSDQLAHVPSSVYGVEHLLRLFVKFPHFLSKAQFPSAHIHLLHQYFKDFLLYIAKIPELFSEDSYENPNTNSTDIADSVVT